MTAAAAPASNILGNKSRSIHASPKAMQDKGFQRHKENRYALQRRAQSLLWDTAGGKRQKHRVCHCGRSVRGKVVNLYRLTDGSRSRFAGLMQCGSGWTCPICAARIGEVRRLELSHALVEQVKAGGRVQLLTLTFPHELDMALPELLAKFDKARQRFKNSRTYKRISQGIDRQGNVASLEVTHGRNGWHPHLHELIFSGRSCAESEVDALKKQWVQSLVKSGLGDLSKISDMMAHGLDLRGGEDAAGYVSKYGREEQWGMSSEVVGTGKDANEGNLTPFGLLRAANHGDEAAGFRFKEFADAFHGKRLLTWSRGLRARFELGEDESDEAAAAAAMPDEDFVATLTPDDWKIVLTREARAELLDYVAKNCTVKESGQADVDDFIQYLARRPRVALGWFWQPMQPKRRDH